MGFLGLGSDKVTTTKTNQSTMVDPATQRYVDQMRQYGQAAGQAAQGYQTQGLNPYQQQAMQALAGNLGLGAMGPYTPQQVAAQQVQGAQAGAPMQVQGPTGFERVSGPGLGGIPQVGGAPGGPGSMPQAGQVGGYDRVQAQGGYQGYNPQSYQAYMDPYQQQVVDSMRPEFDRQRQQAMTTGSQQATMSGALGNNRGELLQAAMLRDVNQNEAQMMAQLRSQGFGQAQQAAMGEHALGQNLGLQYAGQNLQGQMSNQQAGVQTGIANAQLATQAGIAGANLGAQYAGLGLQGQIANQGAYMQGLGMQQQANLANQSAGLDLSRLGLQAQGMNQSAGLQTDLANAGFQQQAGMQNAQLGLQGQMANQSAGLQGAQMDRSYNLGMGALQAQQANQLFGMGGQARDIAQQQSMDPYTRQMMAGAGMQQFLGPYGMTQSGSTEQRQKGSLFGDLMSLGGVVGGMIPGVNTAVKGVQGVLGSGSGATPAAGFGGNPYGSMNFMTGGYTPSVQPNLGMTNLRYPY